MSESSDFEGLAERMAADLATIEKTRMPFGRYGPGNYPPQGVPIYDLPVEYLGWFARKGWPKGRFGELLRMVFQMKADGADLAFEPLRRRAGGRTVLREDNRVIVRKTVRKLLHPDSEYGS